VVAIKKATTGGRDPKKAATGGRDPMDLSAAQRRATGGRGFVALPRDHRSRLCGIAARPAVGALWHFRATTGRGFVELGGASL
jgi:hypothetical protein